MKRLWLVEPRGRARQTEDWPDWASERINLIVGDGFSFAVVKAEYHHLDQLLRNHYPHLRLSGHPRDGRWVAPDRREVYIIDAQVIDHEPQAWEAMGLKPAQFDGVDWDDVDDDVVRNAVPTVDSSF